jgi:hypothetical protein
MNDDAKRTEALRLLAATDIWSLNYEPPIVRLLWALGIHVPLPHFASFRYNAVFFALTITVGFSLASRLIAGSFLRRPLPLGLLEIAVISALVGLWTARYYADGRRRFGLPMWQELQARA